MKRQLARLLERLGLLGVAARLHGELAYRRALRRVPPERRRAGAGDGLPVPPPRLIFLVANTPDPVWYLESGAAAARSIRWILERNGRRIEEAASILDFGCGCGRVLRNWRSLDRARLAGSDVDARAVAWCGANLPFARFATNGIAPPLAYADAEFDLAYALSVFTHLPEPIQLEWMAELRRVLRPGGHLVLSTHGQRYLERLEPVERVRFHSGEIVVRRPGAAGTNLCTAFHPERAVRERLARGFEVVDLAREGAAGNPHQDLYLLRRESESSGG